jgi:hypothetical protein
VFKVQVTWKSLPHHAAPNEAWGQFGPFTNRWGAECFLAAACKAGAAWAVVVPCSAEETDAIDETGRTGGIVQYQVKQEASNANDSE